MKVKNYDSTCEICNALKNDEHILREGEFVAWIPYPRCNDNPFRSAIVPKRHLGEEGIYHLTQLDNEEKEELEYIQVAAMHTIIKTIKESGMELELRQGMPSIDGLIRVSTHPNYDLVPHVKHPVRLAGFDFPTSLDSRIESNIINMNKTAKVIVASFADAPPKPEDLINEEVRLLKQNYKI